MRTKRAEFNVCLQCSEAIFQKEVVVGCLQDTRPVAQGECYEFNRVQEPAWCDECHQLATEWEKVGPHMGDKRTVCRACLCPELPPPEYSHQNTTPLADIHPDEAGVNFSLYGMNRHLDRRHDELGYRREKYIVWETKQ